MITCDNGCGTRAPVPWWVSLRWLAGRQARAAGVCLSVLPYKCTNNARDYCDEAVVLQFSLRSFWRFVVFESTWHHRLGLTKKDLAEVFFYFCQCGGFASNMGARSIKCMFFFPFLPLHNLFFRPCGSVEKRHPHTTQSQVGNLQTLRTQLSSWHWLQQRHRSQP